MNTYTETKIINRILNTGTIMSIEKNEQELKGLTRELKSYFQYDYCALFNCFTGALQAGLLANGYSYGKKIKINQFYKNNQIINFIRYIGLEIEFADFPEECLLTKEIEMIDETNFIKNRNIHSAIIDFTKYGYGPAAAFLTNDLEQFNIADRLKIFGEQDLKTMWEDKESNPLCLSTIQFNYRLSPLVAGLLRYALKETRENV